MTRNNMKRNCRAVGTTLGVHYGPEDRDWVRKGKVRVIRRKRHTEQGATRHRFAPQPAEPAQIDALVRALADGAHDDHALRLRAGLHGYAYTAALRDARAAGWVARWRKSEWYAGIWQLTDAGRMRLAELEDAMRDMEAPDTGQVDERADAAHAAGDRPTRVSEQEAHE